MSIHYMDRKTGEKKEEIIAGYKFLKWLYDTKPGYFFLVTFVKRRLFSSLYGKLQDTRWSSKKIKDFTRELQIDMTEAKIEDTASYRTFNDFFTRELKDEARPVASAPDILISPADGRVSAWENINPEKIIQVKGFCYTLEDLLQNKKMALEYDQGTCIVTRLCPSDYHRLHFPDSGIPVESIPIRGHYYSVNPLALKKVHRLYCENKRELTLFHSDNFGDLILIEVGATCVGSIIQTYTPGEHVHKGSEKGYFKFGGSTMIVLIKRDKVRIDEDILVSTANGIETKVLMGERIGGKLQL